MLEINQANVTASGGFPLSISQSGSYRLTSNLVVPSGSDGITASVDAHVVERAVRDAGDAGGESADGAVGQ